METIKCPVCGCGDEIEKNDSAEDLNRKLYWLSERFCNFTEEETERLTPYQKVEAALNRISERAEKAEAACGAVLHSIRRDGMVSDHSDEAQVLLNVVGERRTEADAQRMLASKLKLLTRVEKAEAACAEMRQFLQKQYDALADRSLTTCEHGRQNLLQHLLSTDCGKDYVPRSELDAANKAALDEMTQKERYGNESDRLKEELAASKAEIERLKLKLAQKEGSNVKGV